MLLSFATTQCNPLGKEEVGGVQLNVFILTEVICQHYCPVCILTMSKTGETGNQITSD